MIKILELFGGIGACSKALTRLGIDYEIADYVYVNYPDNLGFKVEDLEVVRKLKKQKINS